MKGKRGIAGGHRVHHLLPTWTAGFEKDTDFENYECTEEDTLEALVTKIRAYWGSRHNDKNIDRG